MNSDSSPKEEKSAPQPFVELLEVLPWLTMALVLIAFATGWGERIAGLLPYGIGHFVWKKSLVGVGILFIACAFFRFRKLRDQEERQACYWLGSIGGLLLYGAVRYSLP